MSAREEWTSLYLGHTFTRVTASGVIHKYEYSGRRCSLGPGFRNGPVNKDSWRLLDLLGISNVSIKDSAGVGYWDVRVEFGPGGALWIPMEQDPATNLDLMMAGILNKVLKR